MQKINGKNHMEFLSDSYQRAGVKIWMVSIFQALDGEAWILILALV